MRMSKGLVWGLAVASTVALGAGNAHAVGVDMQPGNWELSVTMEMPGMAGMDKPMTVNQCIKPEDVKDPKAMAERTSKGNKSCKVSEPKLDGKTMSFDFTCDKGGSGRTEFTFDRTTYTGTTTILAPGGPNGTIKMVQHVKAKRTGDC
jgi:hypothetical protein